MTKHVRLLAALVLCLAVVVAGPATVAANATTDGKAKLSAELMDKKVKVNDKARIKGKLEVPDTRDGRSLEPIVVQKLVAGVWVDVQTADCRPNFSFRLTVSFSIAASYQLRLFHPATATASATLLLSVF